MDISLFIHNLWDSIIKYGYRTRSNNMNGLERWNLVKEIIPNMNIEWTDKSRKIYDDLKNLNVDSSESSEELTFKLSHSEWEKQHFLIQHGRIIYKNKNGTIVRLMQIAYNIGQFKAENEREKYSDNIIKYYNDNKLDDINTYIKLDNKIDFRIISMTNKGQLNMLKNMLRSASEVGVDMSLFDVYLTPETDTIDVSAGFHSANFTKITMLKLQTIIRAVEEHEMVLWVDNDIVFLKNPIPDLMARDPVSILMQDDQWAACTGFFLIRRSGKILKILLDALEIMKKGEEREDQAAVNKALKINKVRPTLLEDYMYPNGNIYFNKKIKSKQAKIIHFNYQNNSEEKIERMKANKLWEVSNIGYDKVNKIQI